MDIGSILVNQQFAVPVTLYDTEKLQADLSAGVANVMAGVGGAHVLDINTENGFAIFRHKDAAYDAGPGAGYAGDLRCALGITSNGLMAGFNRKSDGAWVNSLVIDATTGSATFTGAINAESGNFTGTVTAGSIITGSVTIAGSAGNTTLDAIIAASGGYTTEDLTNDLAAGVASVIAGAGQDYRLTVNNTNIIAAQKNVVYGGTVASGSRGNGQTGLAITAGGIFMGYNHPTTGVWTNAVSITAGGFASFAGHINATSGSFTGTLEASSIIAGSATVDGVTMSTIRANAAAGATAIQPAAIANLIDKTATTALTGVINPTSSGAIKVGTITWNTSTGAWVSGTGFAITEKGIIASAGSGYTMSITNAGAATFKGDITGATGSFAGTVSASNITAGTITASVSINSAGSINATGVYGSAVGNAAVVGAPSVTSNIGVVGLSVSGAGVYGRSSTGNAVIGVATSATGYGVYGEGYSTTGVALFAGGSGRIAVGSTSVQMFSVSNRLKIKDSSTPTDASPILVTASGGGTGTVATLGPKLGTNASMAGWLTCYVNGVLGYVPFWQ